MRRDLERGPTLAEIASGPRSGAALAVSAYIPSTELPLPPHAKALYLLYSAAEIEHALMVQYLYAAFSLGGPQVPAEQVPLVDAWCKSITEIAREEMGHLATVENIIQFIGGALCFDRGDFPNASPYSPFALELEPLTRVSLGKYVLAEAPARETMDSELRAEIEAIENAIPKQEGPVNRVGLLYQAMIDLFQPMPMSVPTDVPTSIESADLNGDSVAYQARADEWGLGYNQVLILQARERRQAIDALTRVAEQGEGTTVPSPPLAGASHFQRFLAIYRQFPADGTWSPSRPLPTNPTASTKPDPDPAREGNRITDPVAQRWAQLGNVRYSLLLHFLSHALSIESPVASGERTSRGLLISWTFGEMYNLRSVADVLAGLPRRPGEDPAKAAAGLPFDLPYSFALPQREPDRWRIHRDGLQTARNLIETLAGVDPAHTRYLAAMRATDQRALDIITTAIGR
ncbi:MAG: ferritin-like domain-containing protein [Steroidobacteraceae bacterium]